MGEIDFSALFPVGAKVRCENEMWPGKWDDGIIEAHLETRYGMSWAIQIKIESDNPHLDGMLVVYDYRYLDVHPHNSLVRLV